RVAGDAAYAQHAEHDEPEDHDRPEQAAHRAGTQPLDSEQPDNDHDGDRDDQVRRRRRGDLDALDRGQDGDSGRDHAVAEEQGGAEDPERREYHRRPAAAPYPAPADQRDQRHDPALAVVVGPHHQHDVGEGDDDRHRPEDQRDDPEDVLGGHRDRARVFWVEHRLDGVQRARADVPEHHPESTDGKRPLGGRALVRAHRSSPSGLAAYATPHDSPQAPRRAARPRPFPGGGGPVRR